MKKYIEKFKTYGCLFLSLMAAFMIGAYTDATVNSTKIIEPHQWLFTSFFGLFFLATFIKKISSKKSIN